MSHGSGTASIASAMGEQSPDYSKFSPENELSRSQSVGIDQVGEERVISNEPMTDEEREQAIVRAGKAMQAWYSRYQNTQDPRSLDMAYRLLGIQKQLIEGRSADVVRRLEQERGIA